jgi:thiamine-monophosphate kinase
VKLGQIGEFGLIQRLSDGCLVRPDRVIKAIGDDCAAFFTVSDQITLVTTDLLLEHIHFLKDATSAYNLGYKSLAVNLSDIAAMGGVAQEAFVSIAIPPEYDVAFLDEFYKGMKALASRFNTNLLGGDTTGSKHDLMISISIVGSVPEKEMLCRNGARRGDIIFSSGFLGDSKAGLSLIMNKQEILTKEDRYLLDAHVLPKPYLDEGRVLAKSNAATACIDVSDGLVSDLTHIMEQSRVGATLFADQIPVSEPLKSFCHKHRFDPVSFSLSGGEDYTLLVTVSPEHAAGICETYYNVFKSPLYRIGVITDSQVLQLQHPDGTIENITASGWEHFKSSNDNV